MSNEGERLHILEMLDSGAITAEQAVALIKALEDESAVSEVVAPLESAPVTPPPGSSVASASPVAEAETVPPRTSTTPAEPAEPVVLTGSSVPPSVPGPRRYRNFWQIPLWIGAAITVIGGVLMFLAWRGSGFGFWFACTWFPFLLGVLVLALAWTTRNAPWLHLRVQQKPGERPQNIVLSFPLPVRFVKWVMRTFNIRMPGKEGLDMDTALSMLDHVSPEAPLYVQVDDEDGEKVEIYIG